MGAIAVEPIGRFAPVHGFGYLDFEQSGGVGDQEATSNLISLVMEVPIRVNSAPTTVQTTNEVDLPGLGECRLGRDSVLGNFIEDYHPHYQLIVGPIEKKYITHYLPGAMGRNTLFRICAYFLPCQSDISVKIEVSRQHEEGFLLQEEASGEGYLGYTTHL